MNDMRDRLAVVSATIHDPQAAEEIIAAAVSRHAVHLAVDSSKAQQIWQAEHHVAPRETEVHMDKLLASIIEQIEQLPRAAATYPRNGEMLFSRIRMLSSWTEMALERCSSVEFHPMPALDRSSSGQQLTVDSESVAAVVQAWKGAGIGGAHRAFRSGA
jgi:hypothetical protein